MNDDEVTVIHSTVLTCLRCRRLLDRCLNDPCYLKIIDGEYREVPKALQEKND